MKRQNITVVAMGSFFVLLVATTLFISRDTRYDLQVSEDLEAIQSALYYRYDPINYDDYESSASQPTIEELDLNSGVIERSRENGYELNYSNDNSSPSSPTIDDGDGLNYLNDYPARDRLEVELCANFRTETAKDASEAREYHSFRQHRQGRNCYSLQI